MSIITAIKPQKAKKNWFNIFLNYKFAFSLPSEIIINKNLKVEEVLSSKEIDELQNENEIYLNYSRALNFLSFRPHSEYEVYRYLSQKKVGRETVEKIMEKLRKLKFLNDKDFALWLIEQRSGRKAKGQYFLEQELKSKGVSKEIVQEALRESRSNKDDENLAKNVALKKIEKWRDLPQNQFRKKMYFYLMRNGFSSETAISVIEKIKKKE